MSGAEARGASRWWARWKALASRAATFQGEVLFFIVFVVAVVPVALVRRALGRGVARELPEWRTRPSFDATIEWARRQY